VTRRVSIFGATGSIGQNTLDLLRRDPAAYHVVALSGGRNVAQLAKDAIEFSPEVVVTAFEDVLPELQAALAGSGVAVEAGAQAIARAADRPADWIMSCIVGVAGLAPSLHAVRQGRDLGACQQRVAGGRRSNLTGRGPETWGDNSAGRQRTFRGVSGPNWRRHSKC